MDRSEIRPGGGGTAQHILVKADEVDTGTVILSPSKQLPLSALIPNDGSAPVAARPKAPSRPSLRRDGSAPPPPPSQPPPAPPMPISDNPTDSLSLPQLKQLVAQFPKVEQRAYAFRYADTQDYHAEIDEWFQYTEQDRDGLLLARDAFEARWKDFVLSNQNIASVDCSWLDMEPEIRLNFVTTLVAGMQRGREEEDNIGDFEAVFHILCGVWDVTAGLEEMREPQGSPDSNQESIKNEHSIQVEWMHRNADLLLDTTVVSSLYERLRDCLAPDEGILSAHENEDRSEGDATIHPLKYEINLCISCLYLLIESARQRPGGIAETRMRDTLTTLEPNFLVYLVEIISRLRWDDSSHLPLTRVLQLLWKSLLLMFGGVETTLKYAKDILHPKLDPFSADASHPILTASPVDYHLFRQEITSKYPSYNPPLPLIPLEIEQKSMLPPLPYHSHRPDAINGSAPGVPNGIGSGRSILHQPVHIATPAPSPPPSPAGPGGKTGKKQNYQTNQNFPFLYPPLDESSNKIGGKGTTEMQDLMVGKKWEGSDIPASIIEAGELFASRMRMTRAMRQLWKERDLFMKYDRGWNDIKRSSNPRGATDEESDAEKPPDTPDRTLEEDERKIENDPDLETRLEAVENFFHQTLPNLQSLIIVLIKVMLRNVQDIAVQNGGLQDGSQPNGLHRSKSNMNVNQNQNPPMPPPPPQLTDLSVEDLNNIRTREISQNAVSGAIFVLLKWFKLSHVLKFEYLTQLLLDSNYLQLTLKYFAHQNLEDLVAIKYDRDDFSFFHVCQINSDHPPLSPTSPQADSDASSDEAIPPPIMRHRRSPTSTSDPAISQFASPEQISTSESTVQRPSVDELGNPLAPLPTSPITNFSFRQFQTSIHLLRILQKVTRSKAHRILLLVQFKSSAILRRILRVPDPMLRLYVLKLFKSQVPYCGRKWRQSNMRVITAIYLHCRPELRDEWLAGMHDSAVEGELEEAVPIEWALRGLTYWWQKREYADVMRLKKNSDGKTGDEEGGQEIEDDERDFFQHELDAMGWGVAGLGVGEEVAFGEEAANGTGEGQQWEPDGGMNMERW